MHGFFKSRLFRTMLGILLALGILTAATAAVGNRMSPQSNLLGMITTPIQKLASAVSDDIAGFFTAGARADKLEKENNELREKIQQMTSSLIDYEKYKNENEFYSQYIGIKDRHADFQFQPARLIAVDGTDRFGTFTIDCGTAHGVSDHDPVITADGLVGYIQQAARTFSIVTTIWNPELNVGVYDSRTRDSGVVSGTANLADLRLCRMSYLSRSSGTAVGDMIVTSGTGGIFPEGLLVGRVQEIRKEPADISVYAVIEPAVDFDNLREMMVITSFGLATQSEAS